MTRDLGDFQTPPQLVAQIIDLLAPLISRSARALEPTCGSGSFIKGLMRSSAPPREIRGFEIQQRYLSEAQAITCAESRTRVVIEKANIFDIDLQTIGWKTKGPLLVIGNPPWVTNSELGSLGSRNLPRKSNLKRLRGIEAMTGSSNFDLAESIWIKLICELSDQNPTIALLCKTSVARNVLQFARDNSLPVARASIRRIDARKHFDTAVDACLFCVQVGEGSAQYTAPVFSDLHSSSPESTLGFACGRMVSDIIAYRKSSFVDGHCPLAWRQGVKHDAASVMELERTADRFRNRAGEEIAIENGHVFPLIKSRELLISEKPDPKMWVVIPQRRIGEDTEKLKRTAPRLWSYLESHRHLFDKRRSSIYKRRPPFSIFGIGDYSFAPFKVAVSGFAKEPRFHLIAPFEDRPVLLDDTCYFLPCRSAQQSALIVALANHPATLRFLRSILFRDAKRPVTKRLLQRIDFAGLLNHIDRAEMISAAGRELKRLPDTEERWPDDLLELLIAFE